MSASNALREHHEGSPLGFHLLAKPTGAVCNLDCSYCFFLSKEMLYPGSRFRMADELLETYLRQLIEAHSRAPEVAIAWQGGEPTLMGVEFFRRSVELAEGFLRAVPADAEPVAVRLLRSHLRVEALNDQRVLLPVEERFDRDGRARIGEPAAHRAVILTQP